MAREPDHPNVVAEVFAAELGADAECPGLLEDLLFPLEVAVAVTGRCVARGRQVVEIVGRGVFGGLQRVLRRRAADDEGEMVRRAGRGTDRSQRLVEEVDHRALVEQRLGLLEQERLVG